MHTQRPVHSRKRLRSERPSLDKTPRQVLKKRKVNHPSGSQPPAAFWDNLSKVWLTRNALRELDRRNNQATRSVLHQRQFSSPVTRSALRNIQKLGEDGGPDLSELRGYREPTSSLFPAMNSRRSKYRVQKGSLSASRGSSTSRSTKPSKTTTTKSSGPYDRNFQQHLIDHGIYPHRYRFPDGHVPAKPNNWEEINERLARPRPSLSPSRFTEDTFEQFIQEDADASKERQVTESVIPFIEGKIADSKCVAGGVPFRDLDHLTDGTLVSGNPDRYHGARPEQLDRRIRNELNGQIIPSTQHDLPIVPNFLLAAKGPDGSLAVAGRQASYDGALGAQSMHSLQTYGQEQPDFDNNAYTITSIYHGGTLKMFTSHPSKTTATDRPEYHMTQLRSISLTDTVDSFRQGATCYRNGRDWAKEQRDDAIRRVNEQATQYQL